MLSHASTKPKTITLGAQSGIRLPVVMVLAECSLGLRREPGFEMTCFVAHEVWPAIETFLGVVSKCPSVPPLTRAVHRHVQTPVVASLLSQPSSAWCSARPKSRLWPHPLVNDPVIPRRARPSITPLPSSYTYATPGETNYIDGIHLTQSQTHISASAAVVKNETRSPRHQRFEVVVFMFHCPRSLLLCYYCNRPLFSQPYS